MQVINSCNEKNIIDSYFKNDNNPKIFVNDPNNLFLINWNGNKHIIFKTNHGYINEFDFKNIEKWYIVIMDYFGRIGHDRLYKKDKIQFIYNGQQLSYKEGFLLVEYFKQESNITIFVNDVFNLFPINWNQTKNVIFQVNQNYKKEFTIRNIDTLYFILRDYLSKIDHTKLIKNNEILFGDKTTVGEFFLNDYNPVVYVTDMNEKIKYIVVTFKTTHGKIINTIINCKRPIEYLLMEYLIEMKHPELMDKNDEIQFLYNALQIKFGDKTTIGEFFHNVNNPVILVMDINNLLLNNSPPKQNIIFNSYGVVITLVVDYRTTIDQLIKMYLYKAG